MERGLNNLRDALRNDWLVADSKVKAALLDKLNQIADGNGVVFGGQKQLRSRDLYQQDKS